MQLLQEGHHPLTRGFLGPQQGAHVVAERIHGSLHGGVKDLVPGGHGARLAAHLPRGAGAAELHGLLQV